MKRKRAKHHGLALMLVLTVVGLASIIGLGMLSIASLQSQSADGAEKSAAADYLAESAIQTAAYYLQRDGGSIPTAWTATAGHVIYAQNVVVSGVSGTFDIDVTATGKADEFRIAATGHSAGASPVTRSASATLRVLRVSPTFGSGFGGAVTIGSNNRLNGFTIANGAITNNGVISGGSRTSFLSTEFSVAGLTVGSINYYGGNIASGTYTLPNGNVGTPQILSSGTLSSPTALTAAATNPGKVFYYNGNVTITGAGTYNGTIIARGKLTVQPPLGSTVNINRQSGFPAVVADGNLTINARNLTLNINGVTWLGTGTSWASGIAVSGSKATINGALLMPGGQALGAGGLGSLTVNYTAANADVINLTPTVAQPATGLKFVNWTQ